MAFVAAGFLDLVDTANDISFVIRIMAFAYITYYLFITLNEQPAVFGLATILAGYFLLFHSPVIFVIAVVVLFVVFGSWIQQNIIFGITSPIETMKQVHQEDVMFAGQRAQKKLAEGSTFDQLSEMEKDAMTQNAMQMQQQGYQDPMQQQNFRRNA